MEKKKFKPSKLIFFISFLPYLLPIVLGIRECMEKGGTVSSTGSKITPLLAFFYGLLAGGFVLTTSIPVLPVCLIYEVFYIVRRRARAAAIIPAKRYYAICAVTCAAAAIINIVITFTFIFIFASQE